MTQSQQLAQILEEFVTAITHKSIFLESPLIRFGFKGGLYWCVEQLQHNGVMTQQEALALLGIQEESVHGND